MDKRLKNTKTAGSTILLFLLLFLFLLSPQSAWPAEDEAEILIFSLTPEKVEEQQGVLQIQISTFSPIEKIIVDGKPQKFPKAASLVWLKIPYKLKPGVNFFKVYLFFLSYLPKFC